MDNVEQTVTDLSGDANAPRSRVVLALGFLLSFLAACLVFLVIGHLGFQSPQSLWPFGARSVINMPGHDQVGFEPKVISRGGVYLKAAGGDRLNPTAGGDYSVFVWFKLRKIPLPGESLALVGKFDHAERNRPGYAISLEGAPDGVRSRVYVSDGKRLGTWYSFSSAAINRKDWYVLLVSFSQNTFVSTYLGRAGSSEPPNFLGGHRINISALPAAKADLVVGAYGASRFRGQIGPFGIISEEGMGKRLRDYIGEMQSEPFVIPRAISSQSIKLWASPRMDLSTNAIAITELSQAEGSPNESDGVAGIDASKSPRRIAPPKKFNKGGAKRSAKKLSVGRPVSKKPSAKR
jgi:hypothetical protein